MQLLTVNEITDLLITNHGYEFLYVCDEVVAGHVPNMGYFRLREYFHCLITAEIEDYLKDNECVLVTQQQIEKLMMEIQ